MGLAHRQGRLGAVALRRPPVTVTAGSAEAIEGGTGRRSESRLVRLGSPNQEQAMRAQRLAVPFSLRLMVTPMAQATEMRKRER